MYLEGPEDLGIHKQEGENSFFSNSMVTNDLHHDLLFDPPHSKLDGDMHMNDRCKLL